MYKYDYIPTCRLPSFASNDLYSSSNYNNTSHRELQMVKKGLLVLTMYTQHSVFTTHFSLNTLLFTFKMADFLEK